MSQQSLSSLAPEFNNKYMGNSMGNSMSGMNNMNMNAPMDMNKTLSADDYKRYCHKMKQMECCQKRAKDCMECVEEPKCEPVKCEEPCGFFDMGWLGMLLLWFIIFTVIFWLIYYSLNPSWVQNADGTINTAKVLLAAIVSAIILVIIIWLIKACIAYSC
jgi:hypothetical protein